MVWNSSRKLSCAEVIWFLEVQVAPIREAPSVASVPWCLQMTVFIWA